MCTDKVGIGMFVPSPWCGRGMFLFPNLPHESNKTCKLTDELTSLSLLQLAPPSSSESIFSPTKITNKRPSKWQLVCVSFPSAQFSFCSIATTFLTFHRWRPRPGLLDPRRRSSCDDVLRCSQRRQRCFPTQQGLLYADRHLFYPRCSPHLPMGLLLRVRCR